MKKKNWRRKLIDWLLDDVSKVNWNLLFLMMMVISTLILSMLPKELA